MDFSVTKITDLFHLLIEVNTVILNINFFSLSCVRFKEDRNCSRLIAENLGTDVEVSPAQVSNKLRRMGLKVSQRKRRQYADEAFSATSKNLKGESNGVERNNLLDSDVLGESSLSQPSYVNLSLLTF